MQYWNAKCRSWDAGDDDNNNLVNSRETRLAASIRERLIFVDTEPGPGRDVLYTACRYVTTVQ